MKKNLPFALAILLVVCACSKIPNHYDKQDSISKYSGVWAENESDNALFNIKGDSIENVEHGDRMVFKIVGDTMVIDYEEFIGKYIILKITADSLVLENEDSSVTRLYKRH
jgi:hypothetical protein